MSKFKAVVIECDAKNKTREVRDGARFETVAEAHEAGAVQADALLGDRNEAVTTCLVLVKGKGGSVALSELRRGGGKNILIASNDGSEAAPPVVLKAAPKIEPKTPKVG